MKKGLDFKIKKVIMEPEDGKVFGAEIHGERNGKPVWAYVSFLHPIPYPAPTKKIFNIPWEDVEIVG